MLGLFRKIPQVTKKGVVRQPPKKFISYWNIGHNAPPPINSTGQERLVSNEPESTFTSPSNNFSYTVSPLRLMNLGGSPTINVESPPFSSPET